MTDAAPRRRVPPEPVALLLAGLGLPAPASDTPSAPARPARADVDARIEAVLIAADAPLTLVALASAADRPLVVIRQAIERLQADYDGHAGGPRRGFELRETASGWRFFARPEHDAAVVALMEVERPARLSRAALETLAVVAYRQPVTRAQVSAIRAVSVDGVMRTLLAAGLIAEVGRSEETGAVLFGTTDALLDALGIASIDALPPIAPLLPDVDAGAEAVDAAR